MAQLYSLNFNQIYGSVIANQSFEPPLGRLLGRHFIYFYSLTIFSTYTVSVSAKSIQKLLSYSQSMF